ncbi:hypothetical protein V2I01_23035 [Micromonospora sp. BRA006-A]|nr:hypothetical protein [Micromonospora sp. BRA006-A]
MRLGPYEVRTFALPHWVPNAGARFSAAGLVLAYTGDTGPSPARVELARDADLLIAEATYPDELPQRHEETCPAPSRSAGTPPRPGCGACCSPICGPGRSRGRR